MSSKGGQRRLKTYKIIVLGDVSVGKTNLLKRYVTNTFKIEQPTVRLLHQSWPVKKSGHHLCRFQFKIGCDRMLKLLDWDPKTEICLQLYDTAGQERFRSLTRQYFREADGYLLVFDITCSDSLDSIVRWKKCLDEYGCHEADTKPSCVLLANKVSPIRALSYQSDSNLSERFLLKV